jgi:biopolymer transport protein ExbB/TolQ
MQTIAIFVATFAGLFVAILLAVFVAIFPPLASQERAHAHRIADAKLNARLLRLNI